MLAHTILRRILLTAGNGVPFKPAGAGVVAAFDAGGNVGLSGPPDGSPAGMVFPGWEVVAVLLDSSWLSVLSTKRILRWFGRADTLQRGKE
jgi:hypothetical protein